VLTQLASRSRAPRSRASRTPREPYRPRNRVKVTVVLFDHARVAMAQLNRDHRERHIAHGEPAGISMAQAVEIDRRIDPRCNAGRGERALLFGFSPGPPIAMHEQTRATWLRGGEISHETPSFLRKHHMPRSAALAGADPHRARIGVEVRYRHCSEFAIPAPGQQRTCDQHAEIGATPVRIR